MYINETNKIERKKERKTLTNFNRSRIGQTCPGLNADKIKIPYDKHYKVSSLVQSHQDTDNSRKYDVLLFVQNIFPLLIG